MKLRAITNVTIFQSAPHRSFFYIDILVPFLGYVSFLSMSKSSKKKKFRIFFSIAFNIPLYVYRIYIYIPFNKSFNASLFLKLTYSHNHRETCFERPNLHAIPKKRDIYYVPIACFGTPGHTRITGRHVILGCHVSYN